MSTALSTETGGDAYETSLMGAFSSSSTGSTRNEPRREGRSWSLKTSFTETRYPIGTCAASTQATSTDIVRSFHSNLLPRLLSLNFPLFLSLSSALLMKRKYYWRIEPSVRFFCDLKYDPFLKMQDEKKVYGESSSASSSFPRSRTSR